MSSILDTPSTRVLNVVDDVIYVELTGALSQWDTHCFSVDILSPGIKKIVLRLKDSVNNILSADSRCTLEGQALEEVEAASSRLAIARAALWKAYEGTVGIQDAFTGVNAASSRLDTIRNKLSVLRDTAESSGMDPVKAEDVKCEPHLRSGSDVEDLQFEPTSASPCRVLARYTGNPNPDAGSLTKPWSYHVIPFAPSDIPTQLANRNRKRPVPVDASAGNLSKHPKLEIS
ncbi:hypothetical protein EDD16DRAFT_1790483 [Pisolithus croceorrhizus]|nr:hypothetical protein EV401DRAFT_2146585 [Pisolithus croceorrhizus]KAI6119746.1 hypothetical protein EDD16DRAFT_1790483 [Pisolithus croceorrhizus]KAI6161358.1 hypothetical protein EDD17DRAFT_1589625 [Pisolithus thermaeus]